MRRIGPQDGLVPSSVRSLAQDERGIMWFGTSAGLHRYDGRTIRRWAAATVKTSAVRIEPAGDGVLFVRDELDGQVFRVDSVFESAAPLLLDGSLLTGARDIAVLAGELWVARADGVRRRSSAAAWSMPAPGLVDISHLAAGVDAVYAASRDTIWRIDRGGHAQLFGHAERIVDMLVMPDGSLRVSQFMGEVVAVDRDGNHLISFDGSFGAHPMALRGDALWVLSPDQLTGVAPGKLHQIIGRRTSFHGGNALLTDRDGALWLGTAEGVSIIPEPSTEVWGDADGVTGGPLQVRKTDEGYWFAGWIGQRWLATGDDHATSIDPVVSGAVCPDQAGGWWAIGAREIVHRDHLRATFERWPLPEHDQWKNEMCAIAPDGVVWGFFAQHIVQLSADGARRWFDTPAGPEDMISTIYVDRRYRLWIAYSDRACYVDLRRSLDTPPWTCTAAGGPHWPTTFVETEAGTLWLATSAVGVQRFDETSRTWSMIPGSRALMSRVLGWAAPSRRGGIWLTGHGTLVRVLENDKLEAGWEIVERPTSWHGLTAPEALSVFEEANGDLWVVQALGVHHVPRATRDTRPDPPAIVLLDVSVDGTSMRPGRRLALPWGSHQVELGFAAPCYRDPEQLRYRMRSGDAPWALVDNRSLRFVDLQAGTHRIEVAASLDGQRWSPEPMTFEIDIGRPWYQQWWAIATGALLLIGLGVALQRLRTALRMRLVRQRQQIAIDLHDEMGSGLGSIGILAELASNDVLGDRNRREVATRIAETAGDLGVALGDIVWSLRERSAKLDELVARLVERARRLFPEESGVLALDIASDIPAAPLPIDVRRNVLRIALEALHNAARHARASRVTLGCARESRRMWRLWVHDNGVGLAAAPSSAHSGGHGLTGMRERARAIHAELAIESPPGGGVHVTLVFDPDRGGARHAAHRTPRDEPR